MSTKKVGSSKGYFGPQSAGFKIQPKTVLIMSLIYIGLVVLLHIYSKLSPSAETVKTDIPEPPETPQTPQTPQTPENSQFTASNSEQVKGQNPQDL